MVRLDKIDKRIVSLLAENPELSQSETRDPQIVLLNQLSHLNCRRIDRW